MPEVIYHKLLNRITSAHLDVNATIDYESINIWYSGEPGVRKPPPGGYWRVKFLLNNVEVRYFYSTKKRSWIRNK